MSTPSHKLELALIVISIVLLAATPALAQQGSVLTTLENEVVAAAKGWETTILNAARSLFWILAGIEIGIAAIWLAINAASLDVWFAELVRRIMFIGLFAFILDRGSALAKAAVDSLFQIGAAGGSASPANIFDAGIRVASATSLSRGPGTPRSRSRSTTSSRSPTRATRSTGPSSSVTAAARKLPFAAFVPSLR